MILLSQATTAAGAGMHREKDGGGVQTFGGVLVDTLDS